MDFSEETKNTLYKNTIQYLQGIAEKAPNTLNVLKSYYASKFQISQLQTKIILEKRNNHSDARCRKCCLKFQDNNPSFAVEPQTRSKFAKRLAKKLELKRDLTKFQAKYLKKNDVKSGNKLVITCNFCKKDAIHKLVKPLKAKPDLATNFSGNKNKKKKKKDKFAGLHKEVVTSVQKEVNQNTVLNNPISIRKEKLKKKKTLAKLSIMLNRKQSQPSNNLALFLENLNENGEQFLFNFNNPTNKGKPNVSLEKNLDKNEQKDKVTMLNNPRKEDNSIKKTKKKKKKALGKLQKQFFFIDKVGGTEKSVDTTKSKKYLQKNQKLRQNVGTSKTLNKKKSKKNKAQSGELSQNIRQRNGRKSNLSSFLESFNK